MFIENMYFKLDSNITRETKNFPSSLLFFSTYVYVVSFSLNFAQITNYPVLEDTKAKK